MEIDHKTTTFIDTSHPRLGGLYPNSFQSWGMHSETLVSLPVYSQCRVLCGRHFGISNHGPFIHHLILISPFSHDLVIKPHYCILSSQRTTCNIKGQICQIHSVSNRNNDAWIKIVGGGFSRVVFRCGNCWSAIHVLPFTRQYWGVGMYSKVWFWVVSIPKEIGKYVSRKIEQHAVLLPVI